MLSVSHSLCPSAALLPHTLHSCTARSLFLVPEEVSCVLIQVLPPVVVHHHVFGPRCLLIICTYRCSVAKNSCLHQILRRQQALCYY